jgi:polyhydroxybutyrate depolymerase
MPRRLYRTVGLLVFGIAQSVACSERAPSKTVAGPQTQAGAPAGATGPMAGTGAGRAAAGGASAQPPGGSTSVMPAAGAASLPVAGSGPSSPPQSGAGASGEGSSEGPTDATAPSPGCGMAGIDGGNDETVNLMHDGAMREYIVHFPAAYDASKPVPLLLNFHGLTSDNESQMRYSEMNATSDERGFVVAYPDGLNNAFNAGSCCGGSADTVDDLGFARAIVEQIGARACIDMRRVYSTGLSNGGMMSFHLGCDAADLFAAIAPVVAFVPDPTCEPTRGVPVLGLIGTADAVVTYDRANPQNEMWAVRNECKTGPMTVSHGASSCKVWTDCRDDVEVQICSLEGMGHCWPGSSLQCPFGMANDDVMANDAMWEFFDRFRLPPMP